MKDKTTLGKRVGQKVINDIFKVLPHIKYIGICISYEEIIILVIFAWLF